MQSLKSLFSNQQQSHTADAYVECRTHSVGAVQRRQHALGRHVTRKTRRHQTQTDCND
jgi:hypothetical protein